jgi:ribosomal protein S18 acetylase RimI-like enzyme
MTQDDVPEVQAMGAEASELKASKTDSFWSKEVLENWVKSGDVMLVAEAEGKVVGFQITQLHTPTKTGYLSDIAIHPDWRRHGIGSQLVEAAVVQLQERGANYVYGLTKTENEKIHALLEKLGFTKGNAFYWFEKYLE